MRSVSRAWWGVGLAGLLLAACGDDGGDDPCVPETEEGCETGLVCEEVADAEPACFQPLEIHGRVLDALTEEPVEGASVVALDVNEMPRTDRATTDVDGAWSLTIASSRHEDGAPLEGAVTLRVAAQTWQPFPKAPRTALPIDLTTAERVDGDLVVEGPLTTVLLVPFAGGGADLQAIRGVVDHGDPGGVLIVAEQGAEAVSTGITGLDGSFVLFNVPSGDAELTGYRAGLAVAPRTVSVPADADLEDVVLDASAEGLGTVTGSLNMADAPGDAATSVLLAVASTFEEASGRGEVPAGLRVDDVRSAFSIPDVPPGEYVVLAAFETDGLVRDPDETIGGTELQRVTVPAGGGEVAIPESFKVTGALEVFSPGAGGLETITETAPTFSWSDDSSEDGYELRVFDAYGDLVAEDTEVPRVTGGDTVTWTWADGDPTPGMVYQFRVQSFRDEQAGRSYISATEDLEGVFRITPPEPAPTQ